MFRTGRKQALFGLMPSAVILKACRSGQWDDAAVSFLTEARAVFAEYAVACATNNVSESEEASVWATFDALVGPMRQVVNNALSGQIDPHQAHMQLGTALDAVVSHPVKFPDHITDHKMKLSRACRDVLVVQCIRVAGTHTDQSGFQDALATAVGRTLAKTDNMYAQMHQAYATLLLGVPGFVYSNGTKKRPGRPPRQTRESAGQGRSSSPPAADAGRSSSATRGRSTSGLRSSGASSRFQRGASYARRAHIQDDMVEVNETNSASGGPRPRAPSEHSAHGSRLRAPASNRENSARASSRVSGRGSHPSHSPCPHVLLDRIRWLDAQWRIDRAALYQLECHMRLLLEATGRATFEADVENYILAQRVAALEAREAMRAPHQ